MVLKSILRGHFCSLSGLRSLYASTIKTSEVQGPLSCSLLRPSTTCLPAFSAADTLLAIVIIRYVLQTMLNAFRANLPLGPGDLRVDTACQEACNIPTTNADTPATAVSTAG